MMRCLVCLCFSKIIVCKDDDFTQGQHGMGLIVATIQRNVFWLQPEWDCVVAFNKLFA